MNIEFIKIEVQNFKSVGDLVVFDYDKLSGLNFVYGKNLDVPNAKNGSGKSTIFIDSLVFALFGKTLKNTNNKYIPNRMVSGKLKPYVKVYFKSDGQLYSCETYGRVVSGIMSTTGMELLKLDDNYNIIEDLTQSSINKTKDYIQNNILGCTFNIFKSSITVSSSDFMNFYEGMSKDQKRKYIETIFNLNCFGDMFSLIKSDLNDTKKEITIIHNDIIALKERISELEEKSSNFENELNQKKESLKEKILKKLEILENYKKEKDKYAFDEADTNNLEDKKIKLKDETNKLTEEKYKLDKIKIKKEYEIKHINELINELEKIKEGLCEKCTKMMNEKYDYENKKDEIENAHNTIKLINEKMDIIESDINEKNNSLHEINLKLKEINEKNSIIMKINSDINITKNDIKNLKSLYDETKIKTNNPFKTLISESKGDEKDKRDHLKIHNKNFKHLEILKDACSENGIKKFIIKNIVKLLNSLIQKYLNELSCDFIVFFDETFDFKFITSTGECEFSNFSAGEKQRIQIATILAFRDLILNGKISSNIFIIDELLDANIDTLCIENVMKILKRKSIESHQNIYIISHRSELADNESIWDNIIKITKENGQSTYEIQ